MSQVALAALLLGSQAASALSLGRLSVQSALGETLKAEIDVTSLTPEEAGTLKVRIAPPASYQATGLEFNAVLAGTEVQLARRADGRPYLRMVSDRAVQEPFVDVILELSWASGRLVREYTLLFDPPSNARQQASAELNTGTVFSAPVPQGGTDAAPEASAAASAPASSLAASAPKPAASRAKPDTGKTGSDKTRPEVKPSAEATKTEPGVASRTESAAKPDGQAYVVKPGDTLYGIAGKTQRPGVSLDQMLVGLYRSNPDAFIAQNMNRLKSGAVLQVPGQESLQEMGPAEARQFIQAQSSDFGKFRQKLAGAAPEIQAPSSDKQTHTGKVQAEVNDRQAAKVTPDKLTLSKPGSAAPETHVSKEAEKKDAANRVAELTRNVEELKKLSSTAQGAASAVAQQAATPQPSKDAVAASAPPVTAALPATLPAASAAAVASAPSAPASQPRRAPAASMALPQPVPEVEQPGLLQSLLENPLVLPVSGGLIAMLGALGFMRWRSRQTVAKQDTGFHESRMQPDSFFGASGGQRVDTREGAGPASSMSYSLSQLDAIGDVDPIAEADVYLAYGRDLQAEEILKEALRSTPDRMAIRLKLLEVYAKRRDTKGFEQLAVRLHADTQGEGDDWAKAQEMGRQIDPGNPLYQPGGAPMDGLPSGHSQTHEDAAAPASFPEPRPLHESVPPSLLDLDLNLGAPAPAPSAAMIETQAIATSVEHAPLPMDLDLSAKPADAPSQAATNPGNDLELDLSDLQTFAAVTNPEPQPKPAEQALDFDLGAIDLDLPAVQSAPPEAEAVPSGEAQELDLGADFGLPEPASEAPTQPPAPAPEQGPGEAATMAGDSTMDQLAQALDALGEDDGDPLLRQLELADEFRQIGDTEGARDVLQELIGKASGDVLAKAQAMLDELR